MLKTDYTTDENQRGDSKATQRLASAESCYPQLGWELQWSEGRRVTNQRLEMRNLPQVGTAARDTVQEREGQKAFGFSDFPNSDPLLISSVVIG